MFDMTTNTSVLIDGKIHMVRFYPGMTGIGSREFWIDNKKFYPCAVRHTDNLEKGNHFLYLIKWRDNPWSKVYIFIKEDYLHELLNENNSWREPQKINL
jgi:hypothetical protein